MNDWAAKRFWKNVDIRSDGAEFGIALDGRMVKTPLKRSLLVPSKGMAEAIADEWRDQGDHIRPDTMPFTRSANAAIDKVADQFGEVAELIGAYGDSDLLCYRADSPAELVARQADRWDPVLDWAADALQARLALRTGVMHSAQDAEVLARLQSRVCSFTNFQLTAFHDLVSLTGSLVLAFAVTARHLVPDDAWSLSRLDEDWQIEQWGADQEAEELAQRKSAEFAHAATFFFLA